MEHITGASRDASRPCTLLAVDLGNTTTRLGAFLDEELLGTWDITTPAALTADEARSHISHALAMLGVAAACVAAGAPDSITRTAALLGVGFITALSLHRLGRK